MKLVIQSVIVLCTWAAVIVMLADGAAWAGSHTPANHRIAGYARKFPGHYPYVYGGNSPRSGFDRSGLTQYIYHHFHHRIPRTAQGQFRHFHSESKKGAERGDLIFFHVNSRHNSHVYHVGIYEGHHKMVAAASPRDGIVYQRIWSSNVTYGTITHGGAP